MAAKLKYIVGILLLHILAVMSPLSDINQK